VNGDAVQVRVHPALVPFEELLARMDGVNNAVQVDGDLTGRVLFQGAGAGSLPTTSAVMADVLDAARFVVLGSRPFPWRYTSDVTMEPMSELVSRYYVRLEVADKPGVLAGIAGLFGDNQVSIASVNQPQTDEEAQTAEIVIMTHSAKEAAIHKSLESMEELNGLIAQISRMLAEILRLEEQGRRRFALSQGLAFGGGVVAPASRAASYDLPAPTEIRLSVRG
jgi:homoserine dehydrogenase